MKPIRIAAPMVAGLPRDIADPAEDQRKPHVEKIVARREADQRVRRRWPGARTRVEIRTIRDSYHVIGRVAKSMTT